MKIVFITIILALVLGGGGTFVWKYYGGFGGEREQAIVFIDQYGAYADVAHQVEQLAHVPGTEGNTDRRELLMLLESILTKDMLPAQRENLARMAFSNLATIKKEIDSAQIAQSKLWEVIQSLDMASKGFSSIDLRNRSIEIVTLARKRAELSARITSNLSESNEHTYAIITRILSEKGDLSPQHITEINLATRQAEERFDELEGYYRELEAKKTELEAAFTTFIDVAL